MATVQVRYIVTDVNAAIAFYCEKLGFTEVMHPAPGFAMLTRGDSRLVLSAPNPAAGGGQPMPDGRKQEPGGWNRFAIEVTNLAATVETLRKAGARFPQRYRHRSCDFSRCPRADVVGNRRGQKTPPISVSGVFCEGVSPRIRASL
jgi:catechol 2,3-dioxygenase-like lactoylglutathione lyase family enzyme